MGDYFGFLPEAMTETARNIDGLFNLTMGISIVVFLLVEVLLVFFLIRYKRKAPDKQGYAIDGSTKAEVDLDSDSSNYFGRIGYLQFLDDVHDSGYSEGCL